MLKLKNGCKTCLLVKNNKQLLDRIYRCSYFRPESTDSPKQIARDYADYITYPALLNHIKRHQFINDGDFKKSMLIRAAKNAEAKIFTERFESMQVQDAVINKGMEKLESGEMKVSASHLLKAAKDKSDAQAKMRDQQLALAEMVAFFASGEDNQEKVYANKKVIDAYDPSVPVTENITSR
jgi:hypothetical protein